MSVIENVILASVLPSHTLNTGKNILRYSTDADNSLAFPQWALYGMSRHIPRRQCLSDYEKLNG